LYSLFVDCGVGAVALDDLRDGEWRHEFRTAIPLLHFANSR